MNHSELSDFLRACASETAVQQMQRQCEALEVVQSKTEHSFKTNCCCRIFSVLFSPSNPTRCLQHCLGLTLSDELELQSRTKVYSNEPDITSNLPLVAYYGVNAPCEETSLVLCNYASWLKVRLFALAFSWNSFITCGPAKCSLYHGSSSSQFLWQLEVGTSRKNTNLEQDNVYVWFWIPNRWSGVFQVLVCQHLKLHLGKLHYRDFNSAGGKGAEQSSKKLFRIVLDNEADVSFFSSMTADMVWTEALVAKYLTKLKKGYQNHCSNQAASEQEQIAENIEIDEFNKFVVKKEIMEEEEWKLDGRKQDSSDCTATTLVDNELNNAKELCTRYAMTVRRFCNILPSEPMLIVQCPGCFAQFKGISNRMLRLIKHIETHSPGTRRRLILQVTRRYKVLFDLMVKRLG